MQNLMRCAGDAPTVAGDGAAETAAVQLTPLSSAKKGKADVGEAVDVQLLCHTEQCIRIKKPP